jgi:ATP-binding cassette subfamily B multidrug efflux pump
VPAPAPAPSTATAQGQREIPTGLWAQALRNWPGYTLGIVLLAAYNYGQYWLDLLLADAMGHLLETEYSAAEKLGFVMIAIAVGTFVVRVLSRLTIFNAGRQVEYELRGALLHHLQRLGPSFYRKVSTGDIMSRATNDLSQVRGMLGFGLLNLFNTVFALASALGIMLKYSAELTLVSLAPLPLLLVVMQLYGRRIYQSQSDNQEALGEMSAQVQSSIAGVRVVRSFCLEQAELAQFEKTNQRYLERSLSLARLRGSMWPVMQSITMIGVLIMFWYGGALIVKGELRSEQFLSFYRALFRLTWPLTALGFLVSVVQRGRAGYARLREVFDAEPDVVGGKHELAQVNGLLDVKNLTFAYKAEAVLRDVSFGVSPGERLAIVGRTGSGKSTLGALLTRLQATPRGAVFLDGKDICDLPLATLRAAILYVQQTPFLFSTTVGRNIGYALPNPDEPEGFATVRRAASEAQIEAELEGLPDGFDTVVGERGVQLSGGQKQRVALARSLVARPRILILDDPLSAVDSRTEQALLDALERHRPDDTLILITHRVSAAARCDRVLVFDRGEIVQRGTHDALSRQGGLYGRFVEEQRLQSEMERLRELTIDEAEAASPRRPVVPASKAEAL